MTTYRVSALAYGFARMWRGWAVIVPVVLANAVLQALLIWPDPTPGLNWLAIVIGLLSGLVFLVAYGLVAATSLGVADGRVGWPQVLSVVRANAARYVLWTIALALVVVIGLAFFTVPGLLVLALTPFLPLAVLAGQRNPVASNFVTIGRRFWRWLVTTLITGTVFVVGWLTSGLFTFFIRGLLAAFIAWLVGGLLIAWFTTAWALIYRGAAASSD